MGPSDACQRSNQSMASLICQQGGHPRMGAASGPARLGETSRAGVGQGGAEGPDEQQGAQHCPEQRPEEAWQVRDTRGEEGIALHVGEGIEEEQCPQVA